MLKIRSISDLDKVNIKDVMLTLNGFNYGARLMEWAAEAARKKIPWKTEYSWNKPRATECFHPSSVANICDYKLYLDLIGAQGVRKTQPATQCIFDTGTAVEAQMQYYLHTYAMKQGWLYNSSPKIKPELQQIAKELCIRGEGDGEGTSAFGGELLIDTLYEIKTIKESGYFRLADPKMSHRDYITQMHTYMACLDLPIGWLMFINKNASQIKPFPIVFDHAIWDGISSRLSDILQLKKQGKKPEKSPANYRCTECDYLEVCKPPLQPRRSIEDYR